MSKDIHFSYAKRRYIFFACITLFVFILPFIRINDAQLFLLSFDKSRVDLFFTKFDMQELYLMPFLFITLFLSIFFLTTLAGRVWCGWSCPQTIFRTLFRDLLQTKILKIRKNIQNKQNEPQGQILKRAIAVGIWSVLALIIAANFMWFFVPPFEFLAYISDPAEHKILLAFWLGIAAWLVYDVVILKENFCVYVCPYARVQSVMFDSDTIQVIYNQKRGGVIYEGREKFKKPKEDGALCTGCEACVRICPTHIDIRKGMQLECINCLECSDACAKVMGHFNESSLIEWRSINSQNENKKVKIFRFRTVAYLVILCATLVAAALMSGKKESMLLNINRTSELYKVLGQGEVENSYVFLVQNTQNKEHTFFFEIDDKSIEISRPSKPITLKAGAKQKVIVTLKSKNENTSEKDLLKHINIRAYATDEPTISVQRASTFIYPKR
ncbi:cytochrome c oxidase accessory protein CcoG [Campylobacter concisus]|uniref:Cytochrome c oxidase accessory protein CcoG n=1 Tax=Campylobacter concisus TaxID=199 RepID=A0A7S9REA9_9BACT|nr:cytochrome c oxidase accessory protein CcoG [Campylobacter concisus]QPH90134.1 cytochrome c oxidase accessory protein CcoG [Campylobacter concisus]